ncbi:MAG: D-alanyl-D-alanine carboxypeptidase family protein [Parachlamydiaceae bacterium]|nr:D-alanyl-D-alanine carboxypeptidase family protein [Parachlamydiaceae bacterium]
MKDRILKTSQLQAIRVFDKGEELIIPANEDLQCDYRRLQSGVQDVKVRKSLVERLYNVQKRLKKHSEGLQLILVEGYRSPEYQERYYLNELFVRCHGNSGLDFSQMLEHVHQFVALPSVAGHPTGGAIDLTLAINGCEIPMGGEKADFSCPELLPTFSPLTTSEQTYWRSVLHDAMVSEGFAPFYGEWWHFSYGDREWAAFYGHSEALYGPLYE